MGRELAENFSVARDVFAEVNDALNEDLTRLMFEGPEPELTLTANAQPALMAVSLAAARVLEAEKGIDIAKKSRYVAGHSLGEYSALAAIGAISVGDAAKLLRIRGQAMQDAVPVGVGGMAAIPLSLDEARQVAEEASQGEICSAANDNAPKQVVLSGAIRAIRRALGIAEALGARRSILLPVSAPFHCEMMAPAASRLEEALKSVTIHDPVVPLISNVTASTMETAEEIRNLLVEQITSMVRWRESVIHMIEDGVHTFVEVGGGKVLSGLVRRIDKSLSAISVGTPADVDAYLATA